jgi:hypothetical protein
MIKYIKSIASKIHLLSVELLKLMILAMIFNFFFQDEFKERPAIASAISSITNYSSTIPQAPGDPDAKPVEKVRSFIRRKISKENL